MLTFLLKTVISVLTLIFLIVFVAIQTKYLYWPTRRMINETIPFNDESFDFIVVGSGSSGAALASRLSENSDFSVLLLEAGLQDNDLRIKSPLLFAKLFKTKYDWDFKTVPQNLYGGNREHYWPRGKVLGGSSSLNANIYMRGSARDYNDWDKLLGGNSGWSADDVWPYFEKAKVQGSNTTDPHPIIKVLLESVHNSMNLPIRDSFTERVFQDSVGYVQKTVSKGIRMSAAEAYLTPDVLARKNLHVKTNAFVTRVVFNENNKGEVYGVEVEFERHRKTHTVTLHARKEVILSAGAVQTPHILMLSGIGDSKILNKHGIKTIIDNPHVGQNLQDHYVIGVMPQVKNLISLHLLDEDPFTILKLLIDWMTNGVGLFGSNGAELNGMWTSSIAKKNKEPQPDFQLVAIPAIYEEHGLKKHPKGVHGLSIASVILRPKSRGFITLNSSDPHDYPIIDPKYYSDSEKDDITRLKEAFKTMRTVLKTKPIVDHIVKELVPGENYTTDVDIVLAMEKFGISLYHPVGTAAMGKVTTTKLNVMGTKNLRVVDGSIMPQLIGGNTNVPCIMIGEKAADIIKDEYNEVKIAEREKLRRQEEQRRREEQRRQEEQREKEEKT